MTEKKLYIIAGCNGAGKTTASSATVVSVFGTVAQWKAYMTHCHHLAV